MTVLSNVDKLGSGLDPETYGQHRSGEIITHLPAWPREYLAPESPGWHAFLALPAARDPFVVRFVEVARGREGQCQGGALPSEGHSVLSPSHRGSCISPFGGVLAVPLVEGRGAGCSMCKMQKQAFTNAGPLEAA